MVQGISMTLEQDPESLGISSITDRNLKIHFVQPPRWPTAAVKQFGKTYSRRFSPFPVASPWTASESILLPFPTPCAPAGCVSRPGKPPNQRRRAHCRTQGGKEISGLIPSRPFCNFGSPNINLNATSDPRDGRDLFRVARVDRCTPQGSCRHGLNPHRKR